ncbi:hypothetical protein BIW11_10132, partial [Tropilaelaps mercedesae]
TAERGWALDGASECICSNSGAVPATPAALQRERTWVEIRLCSCVLFSQAFLPFLPHSNDETCLLLSTPLERVACLYVDHSRRRVRSLCLSKAKTGTVHALETVEYRWNTIWLLCSPNEDSRLTSDDSFSLYSDESWIGAGGMAGLSGDVGIDEVYIRVKQREQLHLWPLKEDLADWLNTILDTSDITADNFMSKLDNGVVVCRLARLIQMRAQQIEQENPTTKTNIPPFDFKCWPDAKKSSFFARDNTENFLKWCRKLRINEAIMFESDGLGELLELSTSSSQSRVFKPEVDQPFLAGETHLFRRVYAIQSSSNNSVNLGSAASAK